MTAIPTKVDVPVQNTNSIYQSAVKDFLNNPSNKDKLDLASCQSITDVFKEIEKAQEEQGRTRTLRNMRKIQPFLDSIRQYAEVLDTFVQVKPDVLALIWGPIRFLIQVSKNSVKGFDKVLEMARKISESLPEFSNFALIFNENKAVTDILSLIYRDILDFYAIMLHFFSHKGWSAFFEALWPRSESKISVVIASMESHKLLLNSEVSVTMIREARLAQSQVLEQYDRQQMARERQEFEACKSAMNPRLYDLEMERLQGECCEHTCRWLEQDVDFKRWYKSKSRSSTFCWLCGIPGAGKSHISATFVVNARKRKENILFTFFSHHYQETSTVVDFLRSLIFQLLYDNPDMRPIMQNSYENNFRELHSSALFNRDLFCSLVQHVRQTFIVVDGLDEIPEKDRQGILLELVEVSKQCPGLKVMISSREETDIGRLLQSRAILVRVGTRNAEDIALYCNKEANVWLDGLDLEDEVYDEISGLVRCVTDNANGMFLYVRLVIENLKDQPSIDEIRREVRSLPRGLDAAYARIIERIRRLHPTQEYNAKRILDWVACSRVPLRREEITQALMIKEGDTSLAFERKLLQELRQLCGPIIEIQNEYIYFVHFTAKEYLLNTLSGPYILLYDAHCKISQTCLTYLLFQCFEPTLSASQIDAAIVDGHYTLQVYATVYWLEHLKQACSGALDPWNFQQLESKALSLIQRRLNPKFLLDSREHKTVAELEVFKLSSPQLYRWLCAIDSANSLEMGTGSKEEGPLLLHNHWNKVQVRYKNLVCHGYQHIPHCNCLGLERHYGARIHKCDQLYCIHSRVGFASEQERDRHSARHVRSFKCGFPTCEFSEIGFYTKAQLKHHTLICHMEPLEPQDPIPIVLDSDTSMTAMIDAVELGEAEYLRALLTAASHTPLNILVHLAYLRGAKTKVLELLESFGADLDDRITLHQLRQTTHYAKSTPDLSPHIRRAMFKIREEYKIFEGSLTTLSGSDGPQNALTEAIEGGSVEVVHWVLSRYAHKDHNVKDSDRTITPVDYLFQRHLKRNALKSSRKPLPIEIIALLLDHGFSTASGTALRSLIQCTFSNEEHLSYIEAARLLLERGAIVKPDMLHWLVGTNFSCQLAQLLIEHGADLNALYIFDPEKSLYDGQQHETVLNCTLRSNSKQAAEFARFLLESGAMTTLKEDEMNKGSRKMNPKKFARWAGMPWDELVRTTQAHQISGK